MIIVSQDRETIVNFDKIKSIYVLRDCYSQEKGIERYNIDYAADEDINFVIGTYETRERAKEVLQEIVELYLMTDLIIGDVGYNNVVNYPKVYEMPEE